MPFGTSFRTLLATAGSIAEYLIDNAALFDGSTGYLSFKPAIAGDRRTWTFSCWVQFYYDSAASLLLMESRTDGSNRTNIQITPDGSVAFRDWDASASATADIQTSAILRDPTAWYHILVQVDTTQATASNRVKIIINGVEQTSFSVSTYPSQNRDTHINNTDAHALCTVTTASANFFNGYVANAALVDGTALTPSSFGETDATTGDWVPIDIPATLDLGQNGFIHKFSDATDLGASEQQPTGVRYATGNPAARDIAGTGGTWSNGNKTNTADSGANSLGAYSTLNLESQKYYAEFVYTTTATTTTEQYVGITSPQRYYRVDGQVYNGSSWGAGGASLAVNDVLGVTYDGPSGEVKFYKNNSLQYTFSGVTAIDTARFYARATYGGAWTARYADTDWTYSAPTGFTSLSTTNLPAVDSSVVSSHFKTVLWTGNGAIQSITGLGFQPDFVWTKKRSAADANKVYDSIRGAYFRIMSDQTAAEISDNDLSSFDSDGFTGTYDSGATYVAWCASLPSDEVNSSGDITVTWKYNATLGMAAGTYTGTGTAGHTLGLPTINGEAPKCAVVKDMGAVNPWIAYHEAIGATKYLLLNTTDAAATGSTLWNDTAPTSSLFTLGSDSSVNGATEHVIYAFWETDFIKTGSYTGNNDVDGPFVNEMIDPVWTLIKSSTSGGESWLTYDNVRDPYNSVSHYLNPNSSNAEVDDPPGVNSNGLGDFANVGFKVGSTGGSNNTDAGTYIYLTIGEPTKRAALNGASYQTNGTITQVTSTPTNVYATFNPLDHRAGAGLSASADIGNTRILGNNNGGAGTLYVSEGKFVFEYINLAFGTGAKFYLGICDNNPDANLISPLQRAYASDGHYWKDNVDQGVLGATYTNGDDVRCEFDIDDDTIEFFKNGVSQFSVSAQGLSGKSWTFYAYFGATVNASTVTVNTDVSAMNGTVSAGFKALCTDNLPAVTDWVDNHFGTLTWTGDGTDKDITGLPFTPDFVNVKSRTLAYSHTMYDALRGFGSNKCLSTDNTNAEGFNDNAINGYVSGVTDGGFSVVNGSGDPNCYVNGTGNTYVAWCASLPSDEVNSSGDITVTWKYNATLGMAVGTYTGTGTAGHTLGLPTINGEAPKFYTTKARSAVDGWISYHVNIGATKHIQLESTAAAVTSSVAWNDTEPTASAITLGNGTGVNVNGQTQVIIAFWETDFIKIGSYTGNGNADGPFINEMISPVFHLNKRTDSASDWLMWDSVRSPYNVVQNELFANDSLAEATSDDLDFTANGVKIRRGATNFNTSGGTYIYVMIGQPQGPTENPAR